MYFTACISTSTGIDLLIFRLEVLFMSDKYTHLLDNVKRIHFVGIGGSGMCPLAEILHN